MMEKPMGVYIDDAWVQRHGRYWVARAEAFSGNDNDLTITACHDSPELAYEKLVAGMRELRLLPVDLDE